MRRTPDSPGLSTPPPPQKRQDKEKARVSRRLLREELPDFLSELYQALCCPDLPELADQLELLPIVERCRCGDDFCAQFHAVKPPRGRWGAGHRSVQVRDMEGLVVLDLVDEEIRAVEVLHRPDVRAALLRLFP